MTAVPLSRCPAVRICPNSVRLHYALKTLIFSHSRRENPDKMSPVSGISVFVRIRADRPYSRRKFASLQGSFRATTRTKIFFSQFESCHSPETAGQQANLPLAGRILKTGPTIGRAVIRMLNMPIDRRQPDAEPDGQHSLGWHLCAQGRCPRRPRSDYGQQRSVQ